MPVTIDGAAPPIDFRGLHTTDLVSWVPGDRLPLPLLKSLSERLGREIGYDDADIPRAGAVARLAKRTTQAWYADFESLLFFFIGQGFACFLLNLPLIYFFHAADGGTQQSTISLPGFIPYLWAHLNGVLRAAAEIRAVGRLRLGPRSGRGGGKAGASVFGSPYMETERSRPLP